ncbi:hypothetical protein [Actinoplanes derwentensis]|uniref:hypothetical protein n=1 Tax=Actinoplanes derwentensis TaxID=113562 RepID=UPI0012FE66C1|nr:hypothetical protein [Actinoplanes derwentensis]GID89010.1 hypothetical protein Ade03nite_79340 [Actinoplanes derwentensis]
MDGALAGDFDVFAGAADVCTGAAEVCTGAADGPEEGAEDEDPESALPAHA